MGDSKRKMRENAEGRMVMKEDEKWWNNGDGSEADSDSAARTTHNNKHLAAIAEAFCLIADSSR